MPLLVVERVLKLLGARRLGDNHNRFTPLEIRISKARVEIAGRQIAIGHLQFLSGATDTPQLPDYRPNPIGGNGIEHPHMPVVPLYVKILYNHVLQHIGPHNRLALSDTVGIEAGEGHVVVTVGVVDIVLDE